MIVGVGISKIDAEKSAPIQGKVDIKNSTAIKTIEKQELTLGAAKQEALKFIFQFNTVYEPKIAHILLEGEVLFVDSKEKIEDVLKKWKKDKKVDPDVISPVLNSVLARTNVEALIIARELNLPPPIPLPKVEMKG